jgi:hypothetical protein
VPRAAPPIAGILPVFRIPAAIGASGFIIEPVRQRRFKMRRWVLLVVLTGYATALSQAQSNGAWPKVEIFGGYAANKFF